MTSRRKKFEMQLRADIYLSGLVPDSEGFKYL
jgi:hypothetical protein